MARPFHPMHATRRKARRRRDADDPTSTDWVCAACGRLLGVNRAGRLHLCFDRFHEYLVSFPATATCRRCGALNQSNGPAAR